MADKFDPDERFSLYPLEGEEVIRKLLDPAKPTVEPPDEDEEQDDQEDDG